MASIDRSQMKGALLRSGYLLESRVEQAFREDGFYPQTNVAYLDFNEKKSRELDLEASKLIQVGSRESDYLHQIVLIECVNNPEPLVLIEQRSHGRLTEYYDVRFSGVPILFPEKEGQSLIQDFLNIEKFYHGFGKPFSTQYCSFRKKGKAKQQDPDEWMAYHEDHHHNCFHALCTALENRVESDWDDVSDQFVEECADLSVDVRMYYLLTVLQGDLYAARPSGKSSVALRRIDQGRYLRSQMAGKRQERYLIDVITEGAIEKYLNTISGEIERIARRFRKRHKLVKKAIDMIYKECRKSETEEDVRSALGAE